MQAHAIISLSLDKSEKMLYNETIKMIKGVDIMDEKKQIIDDDFDYDLGVTEEEENFRFAEAVRLAKEKSKIMGKPTCEYDREKKAPYLLYPDGSRKYPTLKDQSETR